MQWLIILGKLAHSYCTRKTLFSPSLGKIKSTTLHEECWWGANLPYLGLDPVDG